MPRERRRYETGMSLHVMNRGHDGDPIFDDDTDREIFMNTVRKSAERYQLDVHAFALMNNHFHLQVTPREPTAVSRAIGAFESKYGRYYKQKHKRIGSIWNARYYPVPIESVWHWLVCLRYIVLNPVRAKIVSDPVEYKWTSYRVHAEGANSFPWLADHPALQDLAPTDKDRQSIFRALCAAPLSEAELTLIRHRASAKLIRD